MSSKTTFSINTENKQYIGFNKENEGKWNGQFSFIQAADTQFGLIDRYIWKKPVITWTREIELLRALIDSVNKITPKPRFMVICGDLVDAFPDWKDRVPQVKDLKETLSYLDPEIKIVCVCGNHDVGDIPSRDSIEVYKKDFGDDYFSFWVNGCKFLVLNSQLFFNSSLVPELKEEQDNWMKNEIKKDSWKHLIVFQHIPWFVDNPNEETHRYFNLEKTQRLHWLEQFKQAGVTKVFCGHYHKNAGGFYDNLEVVVTSAVGAQLGDDKHGYRLVEVKENEITHTYIPVSDTVN